jgi:hypothetical protein
MAKFKWEAVLKFNDLNLMVKLINFSIVAKLNDLITNG